MSELQRRVHLRKRLGPRRHRLAHCSRGRRLQVSIRPRDHRVDARPARSPPQLQPNRVIHLRVGSAGAKHRVPRPPRATSRPAPEHRQTPRLILERRRRPGDIARGAWDDRDPPRARPVHADRPPTGAAEPQLDGDSRPQLDARRAVHAGNLDHRSNRQRRLHERVSAEPNPGGELIGGDHARALRLRAEGGKVNRHVVVARHLQPRDFRLRTLRDDVREGLDRSRTDGNHHDSSGGRNASAHDGGQDDLLRVRSRPLPAWGDDDARERRGVHERHRSHREHPGREQAGKYRPEHVTSSRDGCEHRG